METWHVKVCMHVASSPITFDGGVRAECNAHMHAPLNLHVRFSVQLNQSFAAVGVMQVYGVYI